MQVGRDFVVFADDVSILKCQTEKDGPDCNSGGLGPSGNIRMNGGVFCGSDWPAKADAGAGV